MEIDIEKCLACGACVKVCPSNALREECSGYRVLLGGKLGRHPQLARELEGVFCKKEAIETVDKCLQLYMSLNKAGERFGEVLNHTDEQLLSDALLSKACFKKTEK